MARNKITKRTVDEAKPGDRDSFVWDTEVRGFGLKVTPAGNKSYVFQYRSRGGGLRTHRVTIGRHGSPWTPDMARAEAKRLMGAVSQGGHPQQEKRQGRANATTLAFDTYIELFIERYLPVKWQRWQGEAARLLRREAKPHFGSTPLPLITKRDVTSLFDKLRSKPGIAKNVSTVLRKMFNWAEGRGDIEISPMLRIELPAGPAAKERYLCDAEMAAVWGETCASDHPYFALVRLLLVLGQRRDEVSEMRWGEIDLDAGIWTIPGTRTKNKKAHMVPLPALAVAELKRIPGREGWVFSASGKGPVQNWSYWKRRLSAAVQTNLVAAGFPAPQPWTVHDLRRSVGTGMQRIGINRDWVEATQNRALPGSMASRYQRHEFLEEKRDALDRWACHLQKAVTAYSIAALAKGVTAKVGSSTS
jgi:integrase